MAPAGIAAGPSRFPTPDFLFATEQSENSNRPVETITPLAQALNLKINHDFKDSPATRGSKASSRRY